MPGTVDDNVINIIAMSVSVHISHFPCHAGQGAQAVNMARKQGTRNTDLSWGAQ